MRGNHRLWITAALAGVIITFGVIAKSVVLFIAGTILCAWLLTYQAAFLRRVNQFKILNYSIDATRTRVAVGEPTVISLSVESKISFPCKVEITPQLSPNMDQPESSPRLTLNEGEQSASSPFVISSSIVGNTTVGPLTVDILGPGGFFETTLSWDETIEIEVRPHAPRNLHIGEGGRPFSTLYGEHKTGRAGSGLEPYEVREYQPGDSLSRIDWKATARLNHPHVREYEQTTTNETALVVDHRHAMGEGIQRGTKLEYLREVSLAFVNSAESFDDPLGLYTVGDYGVTASYNPAAGVEQYDRVRRQIHNLEPTTPSQSVDVRNGVSPEQARQLTAQLADDQTSFGQTLRPYFAATDNYVQRLATKPLVRTVRLAQSHCRAGSWTVIVTDDTDRTGIYEAVKAGRQNGSQVLVFLAPSVLYEPGGLNSIDRAYDRYQDFEQFRRSLGRFERVSAFEVAPGDRLRAVLGHHGNKDSRRPDVRDIATARRAGSADHVSQQGLTYPDTGAVRPTDSEGATDE
jgi:uncharacterized protein (DUF58 family)